MTDTVNADGGIAANYVEADEALMNIWAALDGYADEFFEGEVNLNDQEYMPLLDVANARSDRLHKIEQLIRKYVGEDSWEKWTNNARDLAAAR
jgi:hypothetical protein